MNRKNGGAGGAQSCLILCDPMGCSLSHSSVHGTREDDWSGLPFPSPGHLPDPGIEPKSSASPTLAGRLFTAKPSGKPYNPGK